MAEIGNNHCEITVLQKDLSTDKKEQVLTCMARHEHTCVHIHTCSLPLSTEGLRRWDVPMAMSLYRRNTCTKVLVPKHHSLQERKQGSLEKWGVSRWGRRKYKMYLENLVLRRKEVLKNYGSCRKDIGANLRELLLAKSGIISA